LEVLDAGRVGVEALKVGAERLAILLDTLRDL